MRIAVTCYIIQSIADNSDFRSTQSNAHHAVYIETDIKYVSASATSASMQFR